MTNSAFNNHAERPSGLTRSDRKTLYAKFSYPSDMISGTLPSLMVYDSDPAKIINDRGGMPSKDSSS